MDTISQNTPIRTQAVLVCPVCGHSGLVLHHSITDRTHGVAGQWNTMRCSHCQSGWLNPAPIPDDLAACYVGAYYTHDAPPPCTLGSSKSAVFMRTAVLSFQKGYRHLQPATPLAPVAGALLTLIPQVRKRASFDVGDMVLPFRKGGRLLEIGCGAGYYLSQMKLLGWSVCGIEIDPVAAGVAAKIAGGNVHVGTIEDAPFEPGSFDAVVSHHVIEHVYNPKSFIATAGRLLAQGGVIAVQTPNFQSLGHKLFGVDWFSLILPGIFAFLLPVPWRAFSKIPVCLAKSGRLP